MNRILFFLILIVSSIGCFKERIDIDNNKDANKKIVITGWINSLEEAQFISVNRTVNYIGNGGTDPVSGATVRLQDASTSYTMTEREAGFYYLPDTWEAKVGDKYRLEVTVEGETYTAEETMRPCPEIENLSYQLAPELEEEDTTSYRYVTRFDFQEIPGDGDAYYGVDYVKGSPARDSLVYGEYVNDLFADGQYFTDIILAEGEYFRLQDTVMIDIHSIGLDVSDYLQDIESEIFRGGPFDPPPANVPTNISGGAIGYFIVSDARRASIVIE